MAKTLCKTIHTIKDITYFEDGFFVLKALCGFGAAVVEGISFNQFQGPTTCKTCKKIEGKNHATH